MKTRVLILCTANSARSQMAEGLLRHFHGDRIEVESAGSRATFVRPDAIEAMREIGIDISGHRSKTVDDLVGREFDCTITVCDNAREACPYYPGHGRRIHHSFDDPAEKGISEFRRVRDEMRAWLDDFVSRI